MLLDSRKTKLRGVFVDASGQPVRWVIWADTDTGACERFTMEPGQAKAAGIPLATIRERRIYAGGLRFIPDANLTAAALAEVSPRPSTVGGDLPTTRPSKLPEGDKRCLALPDRPCEHYGCARPATYCTSDYEVMEPVLGADGLHYRKARVVKGHYWCEWHYRSPAEVKAGDTIKKREDIITRPQWGSG